MQIPGILFKMLIKDYGLLWLRWTRPPLGRTESSVKSFNTAQKHCYHTAIVLGNGHSSLMIAQAETLEQIEAKNFGY